YRTATAMSGSPRSADIRAACTVRVLCNIVTVDLSTGRNVVENQQSGLSPPTAVNVTVRRQRPREYLTEREIEKLMDAARGNRWGHRDATAILIAYRHGLRASELVALRWDDIELATGRMHVRRANYGGRVPLTIRTTQISKHAPIKPAIDRRIDESNPPSSQ